MIDLHCHFLPGIDDGAETLPAALALARKAVEGGIECAIMTPHLHPGRWENFAGKIRQHTALFSTALADAGIPLRIGYAAEVRMSPEIPLLVERGHVPFLGEIDGDRFMLLEFPHGHIPLGADKLVQRLLTMRVRPVIAHPERNKDVMRDPGKMAPFVEMGCVLQLTAASVCGRFGDRAQRTANQLLRSGAQVVIATDAHNCEARPPVLREGMRAAAQVVGEEAAYAMAVTFPQRIVASQFAPATPAARRTTDATAFPEKPGIRAPAPVQRDAPVRTPPPPTANGAGGAQSLEKLLLRLVDHRLQLLLGDTGDASPVQSGEALAQEYHRELVRRLGSEIYRRIRSEVIRELAAGDPGTGQGESPPGQRACQ